MLGAETSSEAAAIGQLIVVLVVIALWCGIGGLIGWAIAKNKGRGVAGFWLGALLGWIGWIIAACLSPSPEVQAHRNAAAYAQMVTMGSAMHAAAQLPGAWHPDPRHRFEFRYWDGFRWTDQVSQAGVVSSDPL